MKIKIFVTIFIGVTCLIGCAKNNIRETNVKKADMKGTAIKKTDSGTAGQKKSSIKENGIRNNNDKQNVTFEETGLASFISDAYDGGMTASGARYDRNKMTAAHPSLPFDTRILITNLRNKREAEVVIIDRFPPTKGRILNVSYKAAVALDLVDSGVAKVSIKVLQDHN